MKNISRSCLLLVCLSYFFGILAADQYDLFQDPYSPRPGSQKRSSVFRKSAPPYVPPSEQDLSLKTPRSHRNSPRPMSLSSDSQRTPRSNDGTPRTPRSGRGTPRTPRAVPRTPRASGTNPFIDIGEAETRVSPRDILQSVAANSEERSPRIGLAKKKFGGAIRSSAGPNLPVSPYEDAGGPPIGIGGKEHTEEFEDDEFDSLDEEEGGHKKQGSGIQPVPVLNLGRAAFTEPQKAPEPKVLLSPRRLPKAKSLLLRNLHGFPVTDKKNWDSNQRRYYDFPVTDPGGTILYEVRFPQNQPTDLKNHLGPEHYKWLTRAKATVAQYDHARQEKKKKAREYKQIHSEVQATFNNPDVSIEALIKVSELLLEAHDAQEQTARKYDRERRTATILLQQDNITLEDVLRVRELLCEGDQAEIFCNLLDVVYKAQKACEKERFYQDTLASFQEKLNGAIRIILQTETYKTRQKELIEHIGTRSKSRGGSLALAQEGRAIVGKLEIVDQPTLAETEELFEGFLRAFDFIKQSSVEEAAEIVYFKSELISEKNSLESAQRDAELALGEAKHSAIQEEMDLSSTDYYTAKSEKAWATLPQDRGSLKFILKIYEILFKQPDLLNNKKRMILGVAEAQKQAEEAEKNLNSFQWFRKILLEFDHDVSEKEIESAIAQLSDTRSLLFKKMGVFHQVKKAFEEARAAFEEIETRCMIQHVVRGKITKVREDVFHFLSEDDTRKYTLTSKDLLERSLEQLDDYELEALKTGDTVILKMTHRELKNYMYELSRHLEENMALAYRYRPDHRTGTDRCVAFLESDPVLIRAEIHKLRSWLLSHLERESEIFQKIITVYWGEYEKLVSGWLSFSSWKNYLSGDPFIDLQRKKLIGKFSSDDVRVPRRVQLMSHEEEVQHQFTRTQYGKPFIMDQDMALESEEEEPGRDEGESEKELDLKYKALMGGSCALPFSWVYDGPDEVVETTRIKFETETWQYQEGQKVKVLRRREFLCPIETSFFEPIRRLYNTGVRAEEPQLGLFNQARGAHMAEAYRPYKVVKPHRTRAYPLFQELIQRQRELSTGVRRLKDWFQEWSFHKDLRGLDTEDQQLLYFEACSKEYKRQLSEQTKLLKIIKGPSPSTFEHLRRSVTWVRRPLDFFFVEQPEVTPPFPVTESLDLSELGIRDYQLSKLRLVQDDTDPQRYVYVWLLAGYSCLNLSSNDLVYPPPLLFAGIKQTLTKIDISENDLTTDDLKSEETGLDWMAELYALEEVNVSGNPNIRTLNAFGRDGEHGLPHLSVCNFSNIGITDIRPLMGFTCLRVLDLSHNHLVAEPEEAQAPKNLPIRPLCYPLENLIHLEVLNLMNCNLRGHIKVIFPRLGALKDLDVNENPDLELFTPTLAKGGYEYTFESGQFRSRLPELRILRFKQNELGTENEGLLAFDEIFQKFYW